jgi:arylsulfatase A-like enzyme
MARLRIVLIILFVPFLFLQCQSEIDPEKPNIVLFLIDDYGYADISYEGNTQIQTPGIDRIARNGVRFTNFYQSGAACAPTRASLLTGRYHLEAGVWGVHAGRDYILRDETTIADVLKVNGYTTGAFGKWHSGKTWTYFSWNRGFDIGVHSKLYQYFDTQVIYNNKLINVEGPITDVIGDKVVKFISENKDNPFFAYVPFQSIHEPYNCPPDVFQKYKDAGYTDHVARLYGMIEVLDDNIGKILDTIEELGLEENTVVMFMNDDGPSPGFDLTYRGRRMNDEEKAERKRGWALEHRGGKGSIWQGGSLTPFYFQWKNKVQPGRDYNHLSGVIDLFPTILDICGIEYSNTALPVHGRSIWPIISGNPPADWAERRYFDNSNFYLRPRADVNIEKPQMHHIAVHYKNYKLVRNNNALYGGADSVYYELFDLEKDPMESENIVEGDVNISAQLIMEIENWYDQVLNNGRAFGQAVYEVGNWEEPNSPINVDGLQDVWGSLTDGRQVGFRVENWTSNNSGVNYQIDVKEKGVYQVELGYSCEEEDLGSEFRVYTEYDTASVFIQDTESALSETLLLPAGRQVLHIELKELGKGSRGFNVLRKLLVHRIPEDTDAGVLKNLKMTLSSDGGGEEIFEHSAATADFLYGVNNRRALDVKAGGVVTVQINTDNKEQIGTVTLYRDFDRTETLTEPPFMFHFPVDKPGKETLNVEVLTVSGMEIAVHGEINVFK